MVVEQARDRLELFGSDVVRPQLLDCGLNLAFLPHRGWLLSAKSCGISCFYRRRFYTTTPKKSPPVAP